MPWIEGANNEFTSLEGVLEDTTQIILNIKRLRLRLHSDEDVTIRLEKTGTGPSPLLTLLHTKMLKSSIQTCISAKLLRTASLS